MAIRITRFALDSACPYSLVNSSLVFEEQFIEYSKKVCNEAWLDPAIVRIRLLEAHEFWKDDLARVSKREGNLKDGLDHFKHCGHLAYWIRRTSPVIEFYPRQGGYVAGHGELTPRDEALNTMLLSCGMEYLAFDWAFQICRYYERTRPDPGPRAGDVRLSVDYIYTICHFLKRKNVSPHAISLIYLSLFQ